MTRYPFLLYNFKCDKDKNNSNSVLGYLIVYVTGRPDMQLQRVVAWLTQHNFPKGLVSFADGFTTDPLK